MQLASVVFYGRLGEQALAMFNLEGDLEQWRDARVLDCPGGPGSLSARLRGLVGEVVAVDPLYALPEQELERRALADLERTMAGLRSSAALRPDFDLEACREEHIQALQAFLEDRRHHPQHYRNASLPELPFPDQSFDLVLSGHLLFAYAPLRDGGLSSSDAFDLAWHRQALSELCRVSRHAVRLYPAHTIKRVAQRHPYAVSLLAELPPGWRGAFCSSHYNQGHDGCTDALQLERITAAESGPSAAGSA
ncbi:class I SAM-dependent methyltransferase [Synechococcus sp. L2F]|uniref:class I SAM-dependent methyltransferase n=1 Tax=Synechococcus sp. L2F TaxID=2823739 RepID=UPI0020CB9E71|nr:class I SAM-dependent methyltransferase [Synechococcus sp. L2F]MCP9827945.1 class I SAM-dependent methyltransferase [Synechococcus sp. L2F]